MKSDNKMNIKFEDYNKRNETYKKSSQEKKIQIKFPVKKTGKIKDKEGNIYMMDEGFLFFQRLLFFGAIFLGPYLVFFCLTFLLGESYHSLSFHLFYIFFLGSLGLISLWLSNLNTKSTLNALAKEGFFINSEAKPIIQSSLKVHTYGLKRVKSLGIRYIIFTLCFFIAYSLNLSQKNNFSIIFPFIEAEILSLTILSLLGFLSLYIRFVSERSFAIKKKIPDIIKNIKISS